MVATLRFHAWKKTHIHHWIFVLNQPRKPMEFLLMKYSFISLQKYIFQLVKPLKDFLFLSSSADKLFNSSFNDVSLFLILCPAQWTVVNTQSSVPPTLHQAVILLLCLGIKWVATFWASNWFLHCFSQLLHQCHIFIKRTAAFNFKLARTDRLITKTNKPYKRGSLKLYKRFFFLSLTSWSSVSHYVSPSSVDAVWTTMTLSSPQQRVRRRKYMHFFTSSV